MIQKDEETGRYKVFLTNELPGGAVEEYYREGFRTRREAREYELSIITGSKLDEVRRKGNPDILFEELVDAFLAEKRIRLKNSTYVSYEAVIRRFVRPSFEGMKTCDITTGNIRAWQNRIMKLDYKPQYIRKIDSLMGTVFGYAVSFYGLTVNPATAAGNIGQWRSDNVDFWTVEEYRRFIACVSDRTLHLCFELLYWTGMRSGELLALTPGDIDAAEHTISINKTFRRYHRKDIITSPKTKKSIRTIPIHDSLFNELTEYIGSYVGSGTASEQDRLFPFTIDRLHGELRRGAKISGVKYIKLHDFRHSHASLLVELGMSPLLISERLGHEKVETTLNIYSHLYPNKHRDLVMRLEELDR